VNTGKFVAGLFVFAVLQLSLLGCDGPPAAPDAPVADPAVATAQVEALATRLAAGEVAQPEFDRTLAPFTGARFERWPEPEVLRAVSSFQRLRTALVTRYEIDDQLCADDSFVRYSLCETGYPCVAAVQVAELHCLWYVSH
jgi:hypothetical protein